MTIRIKLLRKGAQLPKYGTEGAAGADIYAVLEKPIILEPGERAIIQTGFAMEIPAGLEAQIRPRSGTAIKNGITVLNAPGTIDSDYRGEVGVILMNCGGEDYAINNGDRIAQMVIAPYLRGHFELETGDLSETARGQGGYGSTGVSAK